jgi:hypothetical protein
MGGIGVWGFAILLTAVPQAEAPAPVGLATAAQAPDLLTSDFAWFRGRFEDSQEWSSLLAEARARARESAQAVTSALRREGLAQASLEPSCFQDSRCFLILELDRAAPEFADWNAFSATLAEARPVFLAMRTALSLARRRIVTMGVRANSVSQALEWNLVTAAIVDQLSRDLVMAWSPGAAAANDPLRGQLSPSARRLLVILLSAQILEEDGRNSRVLEAVLADEGWTSLMARGRLTEAFLIAQHSANPPLQLSFLRRLAEAQTEGEASEEYKMLADRLESRISGTQTYGTQMRCSGGTLVMIPLGGGTDILGRRRTLTPEPQPSRPC